MNQMQRAFAGAFCLSLPALPLAAQTKAPAQQLPALPQDMLGSWGREPEDCTESESDGRMHITAKAVEFMDSKLHIQRIRQTKEGWWRLEGMKQETGKKILRRAAMDLRLKGKEGLALSNGPEKPEDFVRCKPAQLQG